MLCLQQLYRNWPQSPALIVTACWVYMLLGGDKSHSELPPCPQRQPRKARPPLRGAEPPGREVTKVNVGDAASAAKRLPHSLPWSLLLSTDQLPAGSGKDKMGNTVAIQWRLMPEMSHTSEQLLPLRGTALKGRGAPLMTVRKEVKPVWSERKASHRPSTSLRFPLLALFPF